MNRRYPLATFFVLAYAISWGLSLFATRGILLCAVPPPVAALEGLLYHFGLTLAAIVVARALCGSAGVRGLLWLLARWQVGVKWYLFIVLYPFALRLAAVGPGRLFGDPAPILFSSEELGLPACNPQGRVRT